jgi:hypothetical protein
MTESLAKLSIRLQKGRDGPDVLACVRADGTRTWQRLQRGIPMHDLTHYAVERVLGLRDGFFGLVGRGWDITAFTQPETRDHLPPAAGWEEYVVSLLLTEMSDGIERDAADFNATLSAMVAGHTEIDPREFTDAELASVRTLVRELAAQWRGLSPGGAMSLELACETTPLP